jgi:hypothetical protein
MADTLILPLANALLTCLETTATANPGGPVIHDVDAAASLDTVCCPGLGYVKIGRVFPSSNFPEPDPRSDRCLSLARGVELTAGIVRCIPGLGTPEGPDCADWTATAVHDADDIQALFSAVCCWVDTDAFKVIRGRPFSIEESNVIAEGGCIERFLTVLVQISKCC